jgi:endoglucanase
MPTNPNFLTVHENQIQDQAGHTVALHGTCLGGWMNMENYIVGFPANESAFRQIVYRTLGEEKAEFFFDRFLEYFFTEDDARFLKSLDLNLLRLPFNYRHFEDDLKPMVLRESGFKHLDRVIQICADYGIYTILDLHAAPGFQNQDWHSDNPSHLAFFWQHKHFQDRTVWLWEQLAEHYKHNPWVAGYNPLNEPSDASGKLVGPFYRRVVDAIRAIDQNHLIFLEGNRFSRDFDVLGSPIPNAVYSLHDYAAPGFITGGDYPGTTNGEYIDKAVLRAKLIETCRYMLDHKLPIWVGEFGPVYTGNREKDAMRYQLLEDQLSLYRELGANWSLWTYKDLGLHGLVSPCQDSKWIEKIKPVLEKKANLGVDSWGGVDDAIRHIMDPIEQTFEEFYPDYQPYPFYYAKWNIHRLVRNILLAEPLTEAFGPLLEGLGIDQIDELMASFKFENCAPRSKLAEIIGKQQQMTMNS